MAECNQFEQCQGHFEAIHKKLDRMDQALRGNGRPGITVRLDRLEQDAKRHGKLTWLIVAAAVAASVSGIVAWIVG